MQENIGAAPTLENSTVRKCTVRYPESDGEPMAETGKHVTELLDMIEMVSWQFRNVPDVHVCGNMFLYYEEGNPRKVISPDVFMVRGVSKEPLRTYKTWEQQPYLDLVVEFASPSTFTRDFGEKKTIYEQILRVKEYYIYDPYHEIQPSFIGFRLVKGFYEEIEFVKGRLPSEVLGLDLGEHDAALRLYDPVANVWLGPSRERLSEAETRVSEAETRIEQEASARQAAEAELEKLRETLKRLQTPE